VGRVATTNEHELFSVTGASIFLQIAADTVRRHADNGLLPCIRNSSNARHFKRTDLERYGRKHPRGNGRPCNGGARP
jgi:predicted site-specific integrase-resolvase